MFLSIQNRERIQSISMRISINKEVSLQERIFVKNHSFITTQLKRESILIRIKNKIKRALMGLFNLWHLMV